MLLLACQAVLHHVFVIENVFSNLTCASFSLRTRMSAPPSRMKGLKLDPGRWRRWRTPHGAAAPHRPVTPGQRRRAGPRPPRQVVAGPGFNCRGTAPPGRASSGTGWRRRAGPRLARDGGIGRSLGLFGAQGCAGSPAVSENVCGMSVTAL